MRLKATVEDDHGRERTWARGLAVGGHDELAIGGSCLERKHGFVGYRDRRHGEDFADAIAGEAHQGEARGEGGLLARIERGQSIAKFALFSGR